MPSGVIYTAITGGKDALRPPLHVPPDVRCVCFTDDPSLRSDGWEIRVLDGSEPDPGRHARRPKLLPHLFLPEFEWSLWVDANFQIVGNLEPFLSEHLPRAPFQAFRHGERRCAYDEVEACIAHKKACPSLLRAQAGRYREAGMPDGLAVVQGAVLLRRHKQANVVATMELWWHETTRGSCRDQVSLPYVLWRRPESFGFFFAGGRPSLDEFHPLRRRPHAIEASYPCWATYPRGQRILQRLRCWHCRGERPPFRIPRG
jgi:hypothetical protein